MTGESEPVEKDAAAILAPDLPLAERRNMAYMGTAVAYGRGEAIVVATGMRTELGHIASAMQAVQREPTPLQRRLEQLARRLAVVAIGLVGVVFVLGVSRGEDPRLMFLTAISLAVAAVPEGLPVVVTVTLALGAQRMLRRRALIRKLLAVETLGSVNVICSDKTGTLTQNRMTVTRLEVGGVRLDLPDGGTSPEPGLSPGFELLLAAGDLCNDTFVQAAPDAAGHPEIVGDPTEAALVLAAARFGLWKPELDRESPRVAEVPFDAIRKRMLTVHLAGPGVQSTLPFAPSPYVAFAKAAPEHDEAVLVERMRSVSASSTEMSTEIRPSKACSVRSLRPIWLASSAQMTSCAQLQGVHGYRPSPSELSPHPHELPERF